MFLSGEFDELVTELRIERDQYSSHFIIEGRKRHPIVLLRKTNILSGYQDKRLKELPEHNSQKLEILLNAKKYYLIIKKIYHGKRK